MRNQIVYNLSESVYRADPAINQSSLKSIGRSPAHFKARIDDDAKEETKAMILGRMAGQLCLEPNREPWWTIKPEKLSLTTTEGKDWAKEIAKWNEEVDGKFPRSTSDAFDKKGITVVSCEDFKRASEVAGALSASKKPEVRELLDDSKFEVSGFIEAETASGIVACKCRWDIVPRKSPAIADLKTCEDARLEPFLRKSVLRLKYYIQGASYLDIWNALNPDDQRSEFHFIAIESTAPYAIQVHRLSEAFLQRGRDEYSQMLSTYALCKKLDDWPDYAPGISTLEVPKYFENVIE